MGSSDEDQKALEEFRIGKGKSGGARSESASDEGEVALEAFELPMQVDPLKDPPASRAGSHRAPRGRHTSQMWLDALDEAHRGLEKEGTHPRGRRRPRAQEIMNQRREGVKDCNAKRAASRSMSPGRRAAAAPVRCGSMPSMRLAGA